MNINIIFRRIKKNKKWFLLNILGLSIALASLLMVYAFVANELSYDRFNTKADRICRLTLNSNTGKSSMIDARVPGSFAEYLKNIFPQINDYARISSFRNAIVVIGENSFYSKKIYGVDSTFFNLFDYELLIGNKTEIFTQPKQIAISQSMAKRYFGSLDVIGKKVTITHQKQYTALNYTINGVFKDFPKNSHFKADFLCSFEWLNSRNTWTYTYFLLPTGMDYHELQDSIQQKWDENYSEGKYKPIANLQPLTDIHLHSHKSRELEQNGNVRSLYLLVSGVLIILIIALINFANLNYVQYLTEQKNFKVKIVNGATQMALAKEFLKETSVLILSVVVLGFSIVYYLSGLLNFNAIMLITKTEVAVVTLGFVLITGIFATLPFLYRKINQNQRLCSPQKRSSYKAFVVLQMSLSIIIIVLTLFLHKQIDYINLLHPDATKSDLIVIPNNPTHVIENYETLKENVLKHPEFIEVSAAMEEPAGIVTDNFPYILDGKKSQNNKTVNILSIDSNFFSFFGIKPIAGTINMGITTTFKWEQKAVQRWSYKSSNIELPPNLKGELPPIHAKYILNRMALGHLGIESPEKAIGRKFQFDFMGEMFPEGEIIGVVDDFHYTNIYVKEKPLVIVARKMFCLCFLFRIDPNQKSKALASLKAEWEQLNPKVPFKYEFITDSYQKVYKKEYDQMRVLMLFAIISILLSAMGLFAMVSFSLKIKVKEIGIRRVNGAKISEIMQMLNRDFVKWVVIAFVIATPIAFFATNKWLQNFAYKTPLSWWVFALAGCIALVIALLTVSWQTFRAARRNPVEALRYE